MCLSIRFQVAVSVRRIETFSLLVLPGDEADAVGSNLSSSISAAVAHERQRRTHTEEDVQSRDGRRRSERVSEDSMLSRYDI